MQDKHRILVVSHAHPDFSLGGGEIAAYNVFQAYRQHPEVEKAWFLARVDKGRGATGAIGMRRKDEYVWEQGVADWHQMKAANQESLTTWFLDLVTALRPTAVHTHHYAHLGLEYLRVLRQADPDIAIVMTLHEYMAICSNNGQMIKKDSFKLCSRESFDECHQCFPHKTAEDFWLRKHYFMRHFDLVDHFVSPSEFLRQRYAQWGIDPERITVIENGQLDHTPLAPRPLREGGTRNRFGYFGQINPFKGLNVILQALRQMPESVRRTLVVEVHGANLELQEPAFREKLEAQIRPMIEEGSVVWAGPYQPHELRARMQNIDWVLVPSVWWENSPMVIQEAFVNGRPVIASDIGGMAEKVRHGVTGLTASAGNPLRWADTLAEAATWTTEWDALQANIVPPITHAACAQAHLEILEEIRSTLSPAVL